jgi:hypothetical protein
MDCLIVVAAIILVAVGAAAVFSLLHRPEKLVAARTFVAPEVSRPATAGTWAAAQQPTEPLEVKSSHVPRWGVWLAADLSESGAWALYHERVRKLMIRELPFWGATWLNARHGRRPNHRGNPPRHTTEE